MRLHVIRLALVLGLAAMPSMAQVSIHGTRVFDRTVAPGERYAGSFLVRNDATGPQTVQLHQHDYRLDGDSLATIRPPATHRRSNAAWVIVQPTRFTLAAGETRRVDYDVQVPSSIKGAPPIGAYRSLIRVTSLPDAPHPLPTLIADTHTQPGVVEVHSSVQIATQIAGTGKADLAFLGVEVHTEEGVPVMTADLENTGETVIEPAIWVELYTTGGDLVERRNVGSHRLYPGDSLRQRLPLDTLRAGLYEALIVVDAGGENIFGAQYSVDVQAW